MPANLTITGILRNQKPNSTFRFNSVMSETTFEAEEYFQEMMKTDWVSSNFTVYELLQPGSNPDSVSNKITPHDPQ
ncbi:MAG: hypothetical protein WDO15_21775 [Bacteroidota bacterium]